MHKRLKSIHKQKKSMNKGFHMKISKSNRKLGKGKQINEQMNN